MNELTLDVSNLPGEIERIAGAIDSQINETQREIEELREKLDSALNRSNRLTNVQRTLTEFQKRLENSEEEPMDNGTKIEVRGKTCREKILALVGHSPHSFQMIKNSMPRYSKNTISSTLFQLKRKKVIKMEGAKRGGKYSLR